MRRAAVLALVLILGAALAGCLGDARDTLAPSGGQDADGPGGGASDDDAPGDDGSSGDDDGRNGSDDGGARDDGNGTGEDRRGGNGTGDGGDDGADEVDPGWPAIDDAPVRPGAKIAGGTCTTGFVFSSPDNATLYVATAAHCVEDLELGDRVSIADGAAQGTLAYSSFVTMDEVGESSDAVRGINDLALVAVDPADRGKVHPALLHYGGPTELATELTVGDDVLMFGNSMHRDAAGDELDPHEGKIIDATSWRSDILYYDTPGVPGDSGSPVLAEDGRALGVLVHLEVAPGPGTNNAVNLATALAYMEEHTDLRVELKTWGTLHGGTLTELT